MNNFPDLLYRGVMGLMLAVFWLGWLYCLASGKIAVRGGPAIRREEKPGEYWFGIAFVFVLCAGATVFAFWLGPFSRFWR